MSKKTEDCTDGYIQKVWLIVKKSDGYINYKYNIGTYRFKKEAIQYCKDWYGEDHEVVSAEITWVYKPKKSRIR